MLTPETNKSLETRKKLNELLHILVDNPKSISELTKITGMSRSTTRYYVKMLKDEGYVFLERQENSPGRPTLIKVNKKKMKNELEGLMRRAGQEDKKMKESSLTKEILSVLRDKQLNTSDIIQEVKKKQDVLTAPILSTLNWLEMNGYQETEHRITKEGKKFLEQNG